MALSSLDLLVLDDSAVTVYCFSIAHIVVVSAPASRVLSALRFALKSLHVEL